MGLGVIFPLFLILNLGPGDVSSRESGCNYWLILPGLLLYGGGLAIVLTVNDPVSLSDVPEAAQGQAAGVSATAGQFGGALGIAVLYLIFHTTYVAQLHAIINNGPLADLTNDEYVRLRVDIIAAESTGLKPKLFDPFLSPYLHAAFQARPGATRRCE